jgi:hypothetical protein
MTDATITYTDGRTLPYPHADYAVLAVFGQARSTALGLRGVWLGDQEQVLDKAAGGRTCGARRYWSVLCC